jgi:hypothetical protein
MKRTFIIVTACVLIGIISYVGFAQPNKSGMMGGGMMPGRGMMMQNGSGMEICPIHDKMMTSMMQRAITATPDGGVVVLVGNTLMKYDSSLNLVKETEIKFDEHAMQQKMQNMMDACPMCMKPGSPQAAEPAPATQPGPAVQPAQAVQKWTCPMHSQVVQNKPGKCPICGMALILKKP